MITDVNPEWRTETCLLRAGNLRPDWAVKVVVDCVRERHTIETSRAVVRRAVESKEQTQAVRVMKRSGIARATICQGE